MENSDKDALSPIAPFAQNFASISALGLIFLSVLVNIYIRSYFFYIGSNFEWLIDYSDVPKLLLHAVAIKFSSSYLLVIFAATGAYQYLFKGDFSEFKKFIQGQIIASILLAILFVSLVYFTRTKFDLSNTLFVFVTFLISPFEVGLIYMILLCLRLYHLNKYLSAVEVLLATMAMTTGFAMYYAESLKRENSYNTTITVKSDGGTPQKQVDNAKICMELGRFVIIYKDNKITAYPYEQIISIMQTAH